MKFGKSCKDFTRLTEAWCRQVLYLSCFVLVGISSEGLRAEPPGIQAYPLQHAVADDIVPRLRRQLLDASSEAKVYSNPQANQVLVQGNAGAQQLAARILQGLDQPAKGTAEPASRTREVRGHRVEGDLQAMLKRLQDRFPAGSQARFSADERTKQIIVVAPADVQREVAQLLQHAKTPGPAPNVQPEPIAVPDGKGFVHQLQNITWRDLESELVRLWGDQLEVSRARNGEIVNVSIAGVQGSQPIVQIDRRSGEVSFTGRGNSAAHWRKIVEAIDSRHDGEQLTQLVPIRNAEPTIVQSTVAYLNQVTAGNDEEITKAVPLSGNRKRNAADLVSMLYQQQGEQARGVRAVNQAPAAAVAQPAPAPAQPAPAQPAPAQPAPNQPARNQPAPNQPAQPAAAPGDQAVDASDLGLIGSVQVEILNDTIIIRGNKKDVERVKKLIEDIDRVAAETQPKIEVYHLQHINADAATTLVTELYTEILSERTGQVSIRSLSEPNAILLIGREESIKVVLGLIEKIDQPSPPASRFEIFRLKHVSALDAEQTVRNFFVNRPGTDTNLRAGIGARVQVIGEVRTNSLIVQASPRDMEEVRRLIENIDVAEPNSTAELRVFKLKNALAETLSTVLQNAIAGQPTTGGQQPGQQGQQQPQQGQLGGTTTGQPRLPSQSLELMIIDPSGGKLLRSGILSDVQITADANNNSLIVRAPSKSMELIAALIDQLDRLPDAAAQVKVFTIVNGNATSLARMLQELFGQQVTAGQGANQNTFGGLFGGLGQQLQTGTAGGESSLIPLRFAIDQRTNSIIASGSESDLQVVETILLRLDESLDDRRLSVVRLRNTQASSVAAAVQQYLSLLQQQVQQQLLSNQSISAFESVERQVFVIPENVTNSLIVSATPRFQEEILNVIKELDVRPPMVMVQVLIAEVTLNNTFEFGSEFGFQDSLVFDRGKAVGSVSEGQSIPGFNFNPSTSYPNVRSYQQEALAGQSLANFGVGRANSALGYGGLVLSAASESVNILLRALQDDGRLQILSRPQIMTMHNQPAYVQVGADIARITGTNVTTGVVTQNVEDVPTGLILSVLPLINDDGVIVMGIEAERSALGAEADGTAISSGVPGEGPIIIRPINRTKASTTISARDGQTVVFAGLITKEDQITLRRIPYLSDVPVLGNLFQFQSTFERRSELLVVMTPYLVRNEADVDAIKLRESERMSWCLADVVNMTGDWGLQGGNCAFCNSDAPLIFPDVDPTGTMVTEPPAPATPPTPPATPPTSDQSHSSGQRLREPIWQPQPLPAGSEPVVGPPVPEVNTAMRPTSVTYGPPQQPVTPAYHRVVRLPSPR